MAAEPGTNRHHLYWPRRAYTTALERAFRNLPCNVVRIPIDEHVELHVASQPPPKPSHAVMAEAVTAHKQHRCPTCHRKEEAA